MKYKFIIITINPNYKPPLNFPSKNTIVFKGISYKEEPGKIRAFFKNENQDIRKLATLYSHIHAIKYAFHQPFAHTHNVIIMEDDVEFNNLCPKNFKKIIKNKVKIDIIQLSIMTQIKSFFWKQFKPIRKWRRNFWSACAYRINYKGMEKIMNQIQNNQINISNYKSKVADYIPFKICKTITPQFIPFTYNMRPTTIGSCEQFALNTKLNLKLFSLLHNSKFYQFCKNNNINCVYTPRNDHIKEIITINSKIPFEQPTSSNSPIILFPTEDFIKQYQNYNLNIFYVDNELNFFINELLSYTHIFANNYEYSNKIYDKLNNIKKMNFY